MLRGILGSLSERTKLIAVAVIAFLLGMWFGGSGSGAAAGQRYVPYGPDGAILDTRSGQTYQPDPDNARSFRKGRSLPYF